MDLTITSAKAAAHALRREMAQSGVTLSHSRALEVVAHQMGYRDWNTAAADLQAQQAPEIGAPVPVLRIQDEPRAREFYLDYLGFVIEWEHRFKPELPLYARVRRAQMVIDLSEHHGDGTPAPWSGSPYETSPPCEENSPPRRTRDSVPASTNTHLADQPWT